MTHPVLTDPGVSVPVVLVIALADGAEETIRTRGVVETGTIEDAGTGLADPHGMEITVPDPTPVGTPYNTRQVKSVSVPSLALEGLRVVRAEPSGSAIGSVGVDWRSLRLRVQAGETG